MDGTKATGKTIGEVEKITGIPKRKLKYFIEQGIMCPSRRSESGYWLYSEEDIKNVLIVSLYQNLGYSNQEIRLLVADQEFRWQKELERQVIRLTRKNDRIGGQLLLAELLLHTSRTEGWTTTFDAAGFSPDSFDCFNRDGDELKWDGNAKRAFCQFFCEMLSWPENKSLLHTLNELRNESPDAPAVQEQVGLLCGVLQRQKGMSPAQILLTFRLAHTLSGGELILEQLMGWKEGFRFITDAIQAYCGY